MPPIIHHLLDLFLPATCLSCGADLIGTCEISLCAGCSLKIHWLSSDEVLPETSLDSLFAVADFDGPIRDLIHAFKYRGKENIGIYLAGQWVRRAPVELLSVDAVVPVPMSSIKQLRRGYNPAVIIAKSIATQWKKPLLVGKLSRRWISRAQTHLGRKERLKNAAGSFALNSRSGSLRGQSLLLIDDVCTTGATLAACARLLTAAGARRIFAAVLARER